MESPDSIPIPQGSGDEPWNGSSLLLHRVSDDVQNLSQDVAQLADLLTVELSAIRAKLAAMSAAMPEGGADAPRSAKPEEPGGEPAPAAEHRMGASAPVVKGKATAATRAKAAVPQPEPAGSEATPGPETKPLLVDVRSLLAGKARAGYREEVHALLVSYGVDRLSAVKPEDYQSLYERGEAIGR